MSLSVPLAVRIGDRHITREVSDVSWRKDAVGGLRSISFRLSRPIDQMAADLSPFTMIHVYDSRTAECIAQGRLSDSGRSADTDGQSWEVVAFGPAQHASDITRPLIYIDTDRTRLRTYILTSSLGQAAENPAPSDNLPGILLGFGDGAPLVNGSHVSVIYDAISEAGMKLARFNYSWDAGITEPAWRIQARTYGGGTEVARDDGADIAGGGVAARVVVTNFPNGRDEVALILHWTGAATTIIGDDKWAHIRDFVVLSLMLDKAGAEITTGYTGDAVVASQVVADLLGRCLPQYDGANATVAATTTGIAQLAYPDGITAEQVLEDLMRVEPAYRWYTTPGAAGSSKYQFRWELWPTTVRYEVSLDDGGSFPLSGQEVYNSVAVRWRDAAGVTRITIRTKACPVLDDKGLTRQAVIDLSDEAGSVASASVAGDTFLDLHNAPGNRGTINISRPIRDVISGRMVDPHQIEAGELIRVRGVESYPDALNADSNDGVSVFRIHAVDYSSGGNTAALTLDADPADTASALAKLMTTRDRRR